MSQDVTFTELGPAGFRPAIARFVAVYMAAMNPPERLAAGREPIFERHAANPGFRAFAAYRAGDLAGFAYGFHGVPGQWWHDMVAGALALAPASPGMPAPAAWLTDSFEVAELHVRPDCQGSGIGRSLLLRLLSGRPERSALLSTADTESRARRLYRGLGFTDLLTGFRFSGMEPPYAVMGAELPLRGGSRGPEDREGEGHDEEAAAGTDAFSPRPSIS